MIMFWRRVDILSILLLYVATTAHVQAQVINGSGSGNGTEPSGIGNGTEPSGIGNGTEPTQDGDSGFDDDVPSYVIPVACTVGGVLLLICIVICCCCIVCCVQRRRRKRGHFSIYEQGSPQSSSVKEVNRSSSALRTVSSVTHSIANRLLSQPNREKPLDFTRPSDLTVGTADATDCSNPLYNSNSVMYFPPQTHEQHNKNKNILETPLLVEPSVLSTSPRRHSIGYIEMQSAGPAGIACSRSMEDFAESVNYESVRQRPSIVVPNAAPSYTPPSSPLTVSLPAMRHLYLTTVTPSPTHRSPAAYTSHTGGSMLEDKGEGEGVSEEEEDGCEDEYEDPKLFREDQEKINKKKDAPEPGYEEIKTDSDEDIIIAQKNRAYLDSFSTNDHHRSYLPTPSPTSTPPTSRRHISSPSHTSHRSSPIATIPDSVATNSSDMPQPSYENIDSEEAYLSDDYEPLSEFVTDGGNHDDDPSHETNLHSHTKPDNGGGISQSPRRRRGSHSLDRMQSIDNQYVEVVSPSRKAKSMKVQSIRNHKQSSSHSLVDSNTLELNYENLPTGINQNKGRSFDSLASPVQGHNSPKKGGLQNKTSKSPSPSRRPVASPKPHVKPRPHPPPLPSGYKSRSKSSDSVPLYTVNGSIAKGNGSVAKGNGSVVGDVTNSRMRSTTTPAVNGVSHDDRGSGGKEGEGDGGEVLYVNVESDLGGEELYQNVTHLS